MPLLRVGANFFSMSILVAVNAEKIYHATKLTRKIINNNLGYPDGIGAVYALRKKGISQKKRIQIVLKMLVVIFQNIRIRYGTSPTG